MKTLHELQKARVRAKEAGFTLVELSIVLVIIGLIIGGVLVGQDLIKAAEIRATVSQIEQYNAAVNTFRGRYNGVPGDIRNITSFFDTTEWTTMVDGDGDRALEVCNTINADGITCETAPVLRLIGVEVAAAGDEAHDGEVLQFWHHLSAAELVAGYFDGVGDGGTAGDANSGTMGFSFPRSKMDRNGIGAYASGGKNYFQIGVVDGPDFDVEPSLTPEEAYNLDQKMDDGKPGTGSVIVRSAQAGGVVVDTFPDDTTDGDFVGGVTTACLQEAGSGPYTTAEFRGTTYALLNDNITCSIRLRMN